MSELMGKFQFTPLREGRPTVTHSGIVRFYFNSTPLREGPCRRCYSGSVYFDSCPSARGDGPAPDATQAQFISIHAPPRGATRQAKSAGSPRGFSIHAPPRGATWWGISCFGRHDFNSRPSARGDWRCLPRWARTRQISIHASARGDGNPYTPLIRQNISIHAPPRGATGPSAHGCWRRFISIHALREGRRSRRHSASKSRYFNSRPSARGDRPKTATKKEEKISIHAPPRGATAAPCG